MGIYACKTLTREGKMTEAKIEAGSEAQARANLRNSGVAVIEVRELSERSQASGSGVRRKKKLSQDELPGTVRQMSILIRAGVPLVEGLHSLAEQARSEALSACLTEVAGDISHGMALSDAFVRHPHVFPTLAVEMARIAEAGGNLAESMGRLADHMESGAEIRRRVKGALAYPIVVCVISLLTTLVVMTFILPRFTQLFNQMGASIPWTTKMLMGMSHALIRYWYLFIAAGLAVSHLSRRFARSAQGKRKLDAIFLKLPLVGDVVNKVVISRVVASMATLLQSGVPMVKALEISASAANNEIVKEALSRAARAVAEGASTSQALRASGALPPLVLQMVASGEKTGELPAMLDYVCDLYNKETDAKVKSLTSVMEPVLIVLLGAVVGTIAMSVIVPIYSLVGSVK
jgi:type II secretory pathway component PulF